MNEAIRDARMSRPQVVAVANQKGGVGKTTTAVNLGAELAAQGARVLLVDLDPQANASSGLGVRLAAGDGSYTSYTVLNNPKRPIDYAIRPAVAPGLDLIPASLDLAAADVALAAAPSRETLLRRALSASAAVLHGYGYVLLDCAPGFTLGTQNAYGAADWVLVPVSAELYPLEGLSQLEQVIAQQQELINPVLRIGGILVTMVDRRNRLSGEVEAALRTRFAQLVYQATIPRNVRLSESPGSRRPVREYDPTSSGAAAYAALAKEILHAS